MTNIQAIDLLKDLEQSLDDYCELNDEGKTAFRMAITALEVFGNSEQLPSAQPEQRSFSCGQENDLISRKSAIDVFGEPENCYCIYCHEDSDGYVKPIEKNGHAFICFGMNGWEISLGAKGWNGSAKIMYCPMCGRRLKHG